MNKFVTRAMRDRDYRRYLGVKVGFGVDAIWAVANIILGVLESSVWFITLGAYYMLFGIMRLALLSHLSRSSHKSEGNPRKIERLCGVMLLLSVFVLSGIVTLVMKEIGNFEYHEYIVYAMATFAFYSLTTSIISYVRLRKDDDVIAITNSRVNLAIALVSIFAVEIAMLTAFGTAEDVQLRFIMPILTVTGIAITIGLLGVRSILGLDGKE